MAKVTYSESDFSNDWAGNYVRGISMLSKSATNFIFKAENGYTVSLTGTGFAYGANNIVADGTVTKVSITHGADKVVDVTGLNHDLQQLVALGLGYSREGEDRQNSDNSGFWTALLRGADTIIGSSGRDDLIASGSPGNDTINAGGGDDYVKGDAGNDKLDGGADDDRLDFSETYYDVTAYRGIVLDVQTGKVADSWGGNDTFKNFESFSDSAFSDVIKGSGKDEYFELGRGADQLDGRGGYNEVSYEDNGRRGGLGGINVNLVTGKIVDGWGSIDTVKNIQQVNGTNKADDFLGDAKDNEFRGLGGLDTYNGGNGFDTVDLASYGDFAAKKGVSVDLSLAANQVINDGFGNKETLVSIEKVRGSDLADILKGNDEDNQFRGRDGADKIFGFGGGDNIDGNEGNDTIDGGMGNDQIAGDEGHDTLTGGGGADEFVFRNFGSEHNDKIIGFVSGTDAIRFEENFDLPEGDLQSGAFKAGAGLNAAGNDNIRIVYNTSNGNLYYDHDGKGGDGAELIAQLQSHPTLKFSDIFIDL